MFEEGEHECVCFCVAVCARVSECECKRKVSVGVCAPSPLSQHLKRGFSLSPAPHHPARVHGCQETSGDAGAHGPEGLGTSANTTFNNQIWPQKNHEYTLPVQNSNGLIESLKTFCRLSHLQQAVAHERHQQLVTIALTHHGGVL